MKRGLPVLDRADTVALGPMRAGEARPARLD
jgi:hypothetical protein